MTAPGLAPGLFPSMGGAKTSFGGTMQLVDRVGFELPYPEYTKAAGFGVGQFACPEITVDRDFSLTIQGDEVTWIDDRHIGTASHPARGVGSFANGIMSAVITYGAYTVTVLGTVTLGVLTADITTTVRSVTETHSCSVTIAAAPTALAGTYYSSFGNDINDGLSLAAPKRTLPAPSNGGVYYIERGSQFSGDNDHIADESKTFTVLDAGIGHYYAGNQCDVIATWADATGGAWSATFSAIVGIDGSTGRSQVIEDGFPLRQVADLATCQATAGCYFTDTVIGTSPTTVTVYVHPTDSGNPNSNGHTYEATVREIFLSGKGSCHFEGYYARGAVSSSGAVVFRTGANDGTDAAINRNAVISHGTKHNQYQASGVAINVLSLFCQPESGSSSHFVFHRGGIDVVPTAYSQTNCATIDSPYRPRGTNECSFIWHSDSTLGDITINKFYAEHLGGTVFFPSGNTGTVTVNDLLLERLSPTATQVFTYNNFTVNRMRWYQLEQEYWPGGRLCSQGGSTNLTLTDSLYIGGWGVSNPATTFDGLMTLGGGDTEPNRKTYIIQKSTFINIGTSLARRVAFYTAPTSPSDAKVSFSIDHCQFYGWTSDWISGDTTYGIQTRLPGDFNSYDIPAITTQGLWIINNSGSMAFAQYQGGWFGTWAATDANSVTSITTWRGLSGRYPIPVQTTANPGGFTSQFIDPQEYLGVLVTQAFEAAGRLPGSYTNALAEADILSLSPRYWFDPRTGIAANGSDLISWTDRVGGLVFTVTAGAPGYSSSDLTFDGAPCITVDGASSIGAAAAVPSTQNTLVTIVESTTALSGYVFVAGMGSNAAGSVAVYANLSSSNKWGGFNDAEVPAATSVVPNSNLALMMLSTNFNNTTLRMSEISSVSVAGSTYNSRAPSMGGHPGQYFTGKVCSELYFPSVLDAAGQLKLAKAVRQLYGTLM